MAKVLEIRVVEIEILLAPPGELNLSAELEGFGDSAPASSDSPPARTASPMQDDKTIPHGQSRAIGAFGIARAFHRGWSHVGVAPSRS